MKYSGEHGKAIGAANLGRVRHYMATHIGATNSECASALGLSPAAVSRAVAKLRKEWIGDSLAAMTVSAPSGEVGPKP